MVNNNRILGDNAQMFLIYRRNLTWPAPIHSDLRDAWSTPAPLPRRRRGSLRSLEDLRLANGDAMVLGGAAGSGRRCAFPARPGQRHLRARPTTSSRSPISWVGPRVSGRRPGPRRAAAAGGRRQDWPALRAGRDRARVGGLSRRLPHVLGPAARRRPPLRGHRLLLPPRAERGPGSHADVPDARDRLRGRPRRGQRTARRARLGISMLEELGLEMTAVPANDPFFGRLGTAMATGQHEEELKLEGMSPIYSPEHPTAIMSANCHRDHFGPLLHREPTIGRRQRLRRLRGRPHHPRPLGRHGFDRELAGRGRRPAGSRVTP